MIRDLYKNARLRRILFLILFSFIFIIGILSYLFYTNSINNYEDAELQKLQGIANAVALQVNSYDHEKLMMKYMSPSDKRAIANDSIYIDIQSVLQKNFEANMLKSPIYTLVKSEDGKYYQFGVTSDSVLIWRDDYRSYPADLLKMYASGGTIAPYKDEYGTWLSGFAPIKNAAGKNIAILMVDEKLENFLNKSQNQLIRVMSISILIFTILYAIILFFSTQILAKENQDKMLLTSSNHEIQKMQSQLQKAYNDLSGLDTHRKEMMANLSHDLRTPLANISGYLDLLRDANDEFNVLELKKYIDVAYKETLRLNQMVSDLFDLTKLESGQIALVKEVFDIKDLLSDVAASYGWHIKAKHLKLHFDLPLMLPMAYGDLKYYTRVIQNLMDNAIKHVYEEGFVKLTAIDKGEYIHIKVCNQGDPIAPELRDQIFDRYIKSSGERGGTGLGLAIAQKIVHLHDCEIGLSVDQDINTFWFTVSKA